jgi:hypothetical protein
MNQQEPNTPGINKPNPTTQNPENHPGNYNGSTGAVDVEVWGSGCNVPSDLPAPQLEGHAGEVRGVIRSHDGGHFHTSSAVGTIVWVSQSGGVEVDCRPCGSCCGGAFRRGVRVGGWLYDVLVRLRDMLGYRALCELFNDPVFGRLLCECLVNRRRCGGSGRGVDVKWVLKVAKVLKELLRVGSREGPYAASYLLKRIYDGVPYYDVVDGLVKKLAGSIVNSMLTYYLRRGVLPRGVFDDFGVLLGAAEAMLNSLAWELGFSNLAEFVQYIQLIVLNLAEPRYTNRHAGYKDILSVSCRLCGVEFNVTKPVLRVLWDLTWHFKQVHGLRTVGDVEAKVGEFEDVDEFGIFRRSKRYFDLAVGELADALARLGWVKDGKCTLCGGVLKDNRYYIVEHFTAWHGEEFRQLLKGIGAPQVGEQPNVEEELADAAREVSQRLGIDFELADGAIKSIIYIINSRVGGAWDIDLIVKELVDVDPGLVDRLRESGRDVSQIALTVVEVLKARGLIEAEKHTTGGVDEVKARAAAMVKERLGVNYDFTDLIDEIIAFIEGNVDVNVDELANYEPLVEVAGRLGLDARKLAEVILSVLIEVGVIENEGE